MTEDKKVPTDQVPTDSAPQKKVPNAKALEPEESIDASQMPEKWINLDIPAFIQLGYQYRVKTKRNGKQYMSLRKGRNDRSLGPYAPSLEKLLFHLYPDLKEDFLRRQLSGDRRTGARRAKPYLSVPIQRATVVPGNYRPTLEVIRYYHILKKNNFPGDFSDFINDIIVHHFVKCNGLVLPVLLEEKEMLQTVD